MATETILMAAVSRGADRQDAHESIRRHSQAAAAVVKEQGGENDLLERLTGDPMFAGIDFDDALDPGKFVGRAPQQVDEFISEVVEPIRKRYPQALAQTGEVRV